MKPTSTSEFRIRKQSQHVNGVADSLPSGSGSLDVQQGRQRLPLAHPLRTLELS